MLIGLLAGLTGGLLGLGGGVIFIPGLVIFLDQAQLAAQATSLLAMIPMAMVGAWRQHRYGNARLRDGIVVGALSPVGVLAGAVLANSVSERVLELSFAGLQIWFAYRLTLRILRSRAREAGDTRV
jgi:uncharacterized membrane protein YfcA